MRAREPLFERWTLDELVARHRVLLEKLHLQVMAGRLSIDQARWLRFGQLLVDAAGEAPGATGEDIDERTERVARDYRGTYEQAGHPVPGAPELLRRLRAAGLAIVVVTNNNIAEQAQKIGRVGLQGLIDVLVTSEEVGCCKPDERIFSSALARVAAAPAESVMLGDAWAIDVEGARRAGIRPVWLNRFGETTRDPEVAELTSLEPASHAFDVLHGAVWDRV